MAFGFKLGLKLEALGFKLSRAVLLSVTCKARYGSLICHCSIVNSTMGAKNTELTNLNSLNVGGSTFKLKCH